MAKRAKELANDEDAALSAEDSLLIRSAESLGRVIGSLQRELDSAARRLFKAETTPSPNGKRPVPAAAKKHVSRKRTAGTAKAKATSAGTKTRARKPPSRRAGAKK